MGDCDRKPDTDCLSKKIVDSSGVLFQEIESTPATVKEAIADKQAIAEEQAIADKKNSILAKKCDSEGGLLGRSVGADYYGAPGYSAGSFVGGAVNDLAGGQLDFGPDNTFSSLDLGKKCFDKKLFVEKKLAKDLDFAPIPTLAPIAAGLVDRVDSNNDGSMSDREIKRALNGNDLNEKERTILKIVRDNKDSIDDGRGGISLKDIKEFDAKVIQYNKELAMARKYAPELAEFARELHQRGKLVDENHDGKFSRSELTAFYKECKQEFLNNPSEQGKRELAALNWGLANFHRYALMTGRPGGGQITSQWLQTQILRERDSATPPEAHQYFLSQSDRLRVERYQGSR